MNLLTDRDSFVRRLPLKRLVIHQFLTSSLYTGGLVHLKTTLLGESTKCGTEGLNVGPRDDSDLGGGRTVRTYLGTGVIMDNGRRRGTPHRECGVSFLYLVSFLPGFYNIEPWFSYPNESCVYLFDKSNNNNGRK